VDNVAKKYLFVAAVITVLSIAGAVAFLMLTNSV